MDRQDQFTSTRQFVGTLRYASPEQVLAVDRLDGRSDVYSLGATLWELLTLRPMFAATDETPTPELMKRIQYEQAERVGKFHPGIARDLEAVVAKCLEKNPGDRYASAADLADDLGRWLRNEQVQARSARLALPNEQVSPPQSTAGRDRRGGRIAANCAHCGTISPVCATDAGRANPREADGRQ